MPGANDIWLSIRRKATTHSLLSVASLPPTHSEESRYQFFFPRGVNGFVYQPVPPVGIEAPTSRAERISSFRGVSGCGVSRIVYPQCTRTTDDRQTGKLIKACDDTNYRCVQNPIPFCSVGEYRWRWSRKCGGSGGHVFFRRESGSVIIVRRKGLPAQSVGRQSNFVRR